MDSGQLQQALADPASMFETPEAVVDRPGLTTEQKIEILRRWEYHASGEGVALEEGMPGDERGLLRRILLAIGKLAGPLDVDRTGPSKDHALPKSAIKPPK